MSNSPTWTREWVTVICRNVALTSCDMCGIKGLSGPWRTATNRLTHTQVTTWPGARQSLCYRQGHLHILQLEVELESVGSDEPQLTWCDRAGDGEEAQQTSQFILIGIKVFKLRNTDALVRWIKAGFVYWNYTFIWQLFFLGLLSENCE